MASSTSNGTAPTDEGKKLVQGRNYADMALASLGTQRTITDQFLRDAIGDFNPDHVTLNDRKRMRQDYAIKMGLHYSKAPMITADYEIRCKDPQIAAAAKEAYDKIHTAFLKIALIKYDFGFQGAVKQWELGQLHSEYEDPDSGEVKPVWGDGSVKPVMMGVPIPLPPDFTRVELDKGRFAGIKTPLAVVDRTGQTNADDQNIVPPEWSLWFANEFEEEFRNYYGRARIDPAYRFWWSYWFNYHNRDRHAEMDADPALQVWYPPGSFVPDPNDIDETTQKPRVVNNRDAALQVGAQLRGGATIAWPSDVFIDEQGKSTPIALWRAEFLKGGENLGVFNQLLADLEIGKLRACLVPEQALIQQVNAPSSKNVAGTYGEIFTESLGLDAQYLDEITSKYYLNDWAKANFGQDAPPVEKVTTGFKEEDLTLTTTLIEAAFTADPNALPIKWEEMLERANIPVYTKKEQEERQQALAEQQAEQQQQQAEQEAAQGGLPGGPPGGPPQVGPLPGESPQQLAASQDRFRTGPKKYERERLYLHSGPKVTSTAPGWAHRESARRQRNIDALAGRLQDVIEARYLDMFNAAADVLASEEMQLGRVADAVDAVVSKVKSTLTSLRERWQRPVQAEFASMYHAAGMAELSRLGLSGESWDVGRDEVQEWARHRAGELITTMDKTVVEQYLRPWLATELGQAGYDGSPTGIPFGSLQLAQALHEKFDSYPLWMAERVVRTEARMGYNNSALDMWERVGVTEVEAYDGLGGKTGQTDAECLARNGERMSLDQAREADREEHPNGSLGFVPVTVNAELRPLNPGVLVTNAAQSSSIYGVTDAGLILSEEEVGRALAVG